MTRALMIAATVILLVNPARAGVPSEAATLAVAVPMITKWEGLETVAYLDRIAQPPVWTVCVGETEGVRPYEVRTVEQCREGLRRGLIRYRTALHRYFTTETLRTRLTPERDAAFLDLAWNVGIAGTGKSTATRRLNAGDIRGACNALGWWNKAGKKVIRGLVNRRAETTALCRMGLV